MRKIWLIFTQTVTICLGILFVMQLFKPDLLTSKEPSPIVIKEAPQQPATSAPANSYRSAAQSAMPSVVNIFTSNNKRNRRQHPLMDHPLFRHFFGEQQRREDRQQDNSLGSGVIVSEQGLIITNNHVIASADQIEVAIADGRTLPARIVGADPESDLAILKVDATQLPAITFAAPDQLNVGDVVLAIGNPFGVGQTITQGIVSALGRNHLGINTYENFIQTDASINPGNSGGALINTSGQLVGINSAIYSRNGGSLGIGFAIPAKVAKEVMEQIITEGHVTRGWVGVQAQDITQELADSFSLPTSAGALISGVLTNSPADRAGLKPGDILISINQQAVRDSDSMLNLIAKLPPNKVAQLTIIRAGETKEVEVLIGKRPAS